MLQNQSFSVSPSGVIRGGSANYTADLDTGLIKYQAVVNLPFWQKKMFPADGSIGSIQEDPKYFLSSTLQKVGDSAVIGPVSFVVTGLIANGVTVSVTIKQDSSSKPKKAKLLERLYNLVFFKSFKKIRSSAQSISGSANLNNQGQYLRIQNVNAAGNVSGFNINLILNAEN